MSGSTSVRFAFLRHGESVANAEGWLAGHTDTDLTALGVTQAAQVADAVRDLDVARVVVSDLKRARRTAALAAPDHLPEVHPGLRERTLGDWDGMNRVALERENAMPILLSWGGRPPGGESHVDLARRVLQTLATLEDERPTLVVTHGGVMRVVLGILDRQATETLGQIRYPNCALQQRAMLPGTWRCLLDGLG